MLPMVTCVYYTSYNYLEKNTFRAHQNSCHWYTFIQCHNLVWFILYFFLDLNKITSVLTFNLEHNLTALLYKHHVTILDKMKSWYYFLYIMNLTVCVKCVCDLKLILLIYFSAYLCMVQFTSGTVNVMLLKVDRCFNLS